MMANAFQILNQTRQQFGWLAMFRLFFHRIGAKLWQRHSMEVVWLDLQHARSSQPVPGFEFRFLDSREVSEFCQDPSNDLDASLVNEVERGHSRCFAALDGSRLAAYGWYALEQSEPQHCFGIGLKLPADVSYMFKGFTHPDYRGKRLHAAAMALALSELESLGIRGLISTVESTNEASLRSCDRLGYQRLGRIVQAGSVDNRRVSIPSSIQGVQGVAFIPASDWGVIVSEVSPFTASA